MNAYNFIEQSKDKKEPKQANFTAEQIIYIEKIADDLQIDFKDAVMLLVNKALMDIIKAQADNFLNPN